MSGSPVITRSEILVLMQVSLKYRFGVPAEAQYINRPLAEILATEGPSSNCQK
jgi:hypothetical protein